MGPAATTSSPCLLLHFSDGHLPCHWTNLDFPSSELEGWVLLCLIVVHTSLILQAKTSREREREVEWVNLDNFSSEPFVALSSTVMTGEPMGLDTVKCNLLIRYEPLSTARSQAKLYSPVSSRLLYRLIVPCLQCDLVTSTPWHCRLHKTCMVRGDAILYPGWVQHLISRWVRCIYPLILSLSSHLIQSEDHFLSRTSSVQPVMAQSGS